MFTEPIIFSHLSICEHALPSLSYTVSFSNNNYNNYIWLAALMGRLHSKERTFWCTKWPFYLAGGHPWQARFPRISHAASIMWLERN